MLTSKKFENYLKRENGNIKEDGTKIDDIILPRMEAKPKS